MRTCRIIANQSLLDIAVQEYGRADAAFAIADANGISVTDGLLPGRELVMPGLVSARFGYAQRPMGREGDLAMGREGDLARGREGDLAMGREGDLARGREGDLAMGPVVVFDADVADYFHGLGVKVATALPLMLADSDSDSEDGFGGLPGMLPMMLS